MKRFPYAWTLLFVMFVAYFLKLGTRNVFGAVLPNIQTSFGATSAQIGVVGTVFTVAFGLLAPFSGIISDRYSRKWVVVFSIAINSLGIFLTGFSGSILTLALYYGIFVAMGQPFFYPPAASLLSQHCRESKATAISVLQMGLYAGIIICSFTGGYFADLGAERWRDAFLILGGIGLAWALVSALVVKDTPQEDFGAERAEVARPTMLECVKAVVSKRSAIMYTLYYGLMIFVFIGFSTWTPTLLKDKFPGLTMTSAATHAVLWHYVGAALGVMVGCRIGDRLVAKRPAIRLELSVVGVAGSIPALILLVKAPSLSVASVALFAYGVFRGFFDSNMFVGLIEVIKPRFRASALGLTEGAAYVFGGLAPWGLGLIRERFSMETGFVLFAVCYALAIVLILISRKFFYHHDYEG